jgi:hypothetical protein
MTRTYEQGDAAVGLKAALAILEKWQASLEQQQRILALPAETPLSEQQVERISYLLNIHARLRTIFDNPRNQSDFMSMPNGHPPFGGHSPLEYISGGDLLALRRTWKHIAAAGQR